jgi:transposase
LQTHFSHRIICINQSLSRAKGRPVEPPVDVKTLHAKIGEITLENDLLERALTKAGWLSAKR